MEKISVIGIGYVGLPLAVAFAENNIQVIGFDVNRSKIEAYQNGIDVTGEVGNERLQTVKNIHFTDNPSDLKTVKFHIVAVPTPVREDKLPDLVPVESASRIVGQNLVPGSIVVFESTVYPGVTEEVCIPILEKESGLKNGKDFKVGYSPERINPGDKLHRVENILKVVSGQDQESLEIIASVYEKAIKAGIYKATSIKVAEAAKVIENSQRDINIAFINELSLIFDKMGIDTLDVLEAAGTKWNFLPFRPGLVGGHCIGVDPFYLAYKSEMLGYRPEVILAGRRINDNMGKFIAEKCVKTMIHQNRFIKGAKVLVMGLTFKENCPDLRNSKVIDIIRELEDYGVKVVVTDAIANVKEANHEYGIQLEAFETITDVDAVILAVAHDAYKNLDLEKLKSRYKTNMNAPILMDLKGMLDRQKARQLGYILWRL